MTRILLADDDVELCTMLSEYLQAEGFVVDTVHDGETALARAQAVDYDLLLLDVMMPGKNGFDVLRALRPASALPVLILTARGDDVDSVLGLELGADDYLAKPSNPRVLVARIRAILRRAAPDPKDAAGLEPLRIGDLELRPGTREVLVGGRALSVTSTEYSVLEVLVGSAGHLVSKSDLSRRALGRELGRWDRGIDMHISNLRRKLGSFPDGRERIKTVRGAGYQYLRT
ncbi:MAG: response regulator transcription factor [Thiohalobacteraceae bacterium]